MHRPRRRTLLAIATTIAVGAGLLGAAAPAEAATVHSNVYFTYQAIDGYSKHNILRGSGAGGDTLKSYFKFRYYGTYKAPHLKLKLTLQRKVGTKWVTQKHVKVTQGAHYTVSAKLPAYSVPANVASQKVLYRFKSTKSASRHISNTQYSHAYGVTYQNPAFYTGLQAQMYSYMAPYCGTVAVNLNAALASDNHAGEFLWSRGITIDPSIATYTPEDLQGVALHECAHAHQFYNFGASATGQKKADAAAAKIFTNDVNPADPTGSPQIGPFIAYEHAADCASHSVQPAGYLGYGGYCNPTELAAGNALLTSGAKY